MSDMTLTVLIPCYNGLPLVLDTVQSVVQQLAPGLDCIVVDDGSSDGSADAIEARFGGAVRVVRQPNLGAAAARARALAESSADLVAFLDADDLLTPDSLRLRLEAFAARPHMEMLVSQYEIQDVNKGLVGVFPVPPLDDSYFARCLIYRANVPHLDVLTFRRSALAKLPTFDSELSTADDWVYYLHAFAKLRWEFVQHMVAVQRINHGDNLTGRAGKVTVFREQGAMLRKTRAVIAQKLGSDRPWRKAYSQFCSEFALVLLKHGHRREAFVWAARSLAGATRRNAVSAFKYMADAAAPSAYRALGDTLRWMRARVGPRRESAI
jgi:glycosyltransferase involved in cell wall biosynthesis